VPKQPMPSHQVKNSHEQAVFTALAIATILVLGILLMAFLIRHPTFVCLRDCGRNQGPWTYNDPNSGLAVPGMIHFRKDAGEANELGRLATDGLQFGPIIPASLFLGVVLSGYLRSRSVIRSHAYEIGRASCRERV